MNHSSEHTEIECLNNTQKYKVTVKNSLLKIEKYREIEDKIIKDARNLFRLKKQITNKIENNIVKNVRNLFALNKRKKAIKKIENNIVKNVKNILKLKEEVEVIKEKIIRDIRNICALEENYYKPVKFANSYSNNYIEYGSNDDRNETLSIEEYLNEISYT